jgi:hypothetical protein
VLGAQTTSGSPAGLSQTGKAGQTLPFTGFPIWAAVLAACALIGSGIALRRRGVATHL